MKSIKTILKGKIYPFLGVFLALTALSSLKAMERNIITEQEPSSSVSSSSLSDESPVTPSTTLPAVAKAKIAPVDEDTVDDHETVVYSACPKIRAKFPCTHPGCMHMASNKCNLAQHMMRHTKQKRYSCSVPGCTYAAYFACHIRAHIKNTHKAKNG